MRGGLFHGRTCTWIGKTKTKKDEIIHWWDNTVHGFLQHLHVKKNLIFFSLQFCIFAYCKMQDG